MQNITATQNLSEGETILNVQVLPILKAQKQAAEIEGTPCFIGCDPAARIEYPESHPELWFTCYHTEDRGSDGVVTCFKSQTLAISSDGSSVRFGRQDVRWDSRNYRDVADLGQLAGALKNEIDVLLQQVRQFRSNL